ncbi:NAD+ synthase [Planctomycetota bacterium]|nr:NAD+ synthase [Planctomycetota bacterium]
MKVGLVQLNARVIDFDGNFERLAAACKKAVAGGAELCVAPELATCAYPPHDLVFYEDFVEQNIAFAERVRELSAELKCGILFGLVTRNEKIWGKPLHNSAMLVADGEIVATKNKHLLPTYDVFDERRYFQPDPEPCVVEFRGRTLGILICEDIWTEEDLLGRVDYKVDPADLCVNHGADLLINLSASPWTLGKHDRRENLVATLAGKLKTPLVLVNQVGAYDALIFDGGSVAANADGQTIARQPLWREDVCVVDIDAPSEPVQWKGSELEHELNALQLGVADYFDKTGFKQALIGLSGGIDSALVTCIATRALGPENVTAISMPTRFSSHGSIEDSRELAENLGVKFEVVNIDDTFEQFRKLAGEPGGLAEENLQARIRGQLLMTRSNATGALVLATGNASELAVGYSTLYGDMCGALEVIGDVPKTRVYELSRQFDEMPHAILTKAPSAELRPDQTDQDSLPEYDLLDSILYAYLIERKSVRSIVASGLDESTVKRIVKMVEIAEYKRFQAPPVLRVSKYAFGAGRRIPVAKYI